MAKLTADGGRFGDLEGPAARGAEVDLVTLVGLVFETASGLRRLVGPTLERDYHFPPQSFEVLIRLARSPAYRLRMSDLAAQTALTPSGLTRAIDRLVEAGLVCRHACPQDRRGAFAALSEDGATKMEMALGCHRRQLNELFDGILDAGERAQLTLLLRRLRDHVNPGAARVGED